MAGGKDDDSTDIESLVKSFAKDMTEACAKLRKARVEKINESDQKADGPPVVTFTLSQNPASKSRTPAQQAAEVAAGKSWVCWGAHMADKARHVVMKADGKVSWDPKKALGDDFAEFKKKWADVMRRNGLKNAKGGDGWYDGDEFHLEMPDSKIKRTDERVAACLEEYAKLTRKGGKKKNDKFEKNYAKMLEKHVAPYERGSKK